ncbi:MAG: M20 family metallopeptidase [Bacteroides sp.]|nr:M20 family metallopeptidase [Bacteroides sp.]MCM1085349.1 M20 family metallopeptidase [Bacteroides sp.]
MQDKIKRLARELQAEIVAIRRHLHRHPELSTQEFETGRYIAGKLTEWGIPCTSGWSETGVVGLVEGRNPALRCVALRADMDALPITENTGLDFASCNTGVMHACGHDAHMACLLGAAKMLHTLKDEWEGTVKLIFQPSEEDFRAGAPKMIEQGVLENPKPERIYALHVMPEMECGRVGVKTGQYMASTDEIYLKAVGKAGHGAMPELNIDTVLMSAYILTGLQQVVSRQAPPYIPTVLSFGRIIGEGRTNIIPGEVNMEGTLRTFSEEWRAKAHENIRRCAQGIAESMGGKCEVFIDHGYPFVNNDAAAADRVRNVAAGVVGKDHLDELPLRMTAEDFAYYTQRIPGCMFRLGVKPPQLSDPTNLHTATLVIDENALPIGAEMLAGLGVRG